MVEHCPFKAGVLGSSPSRLMSGGAQRGNNNLPINHLALCSKHYSPKFLRPGESIERSRTEWHSIADAIKEELKQEIAALKSRGVTPGLAAVLVGENPASQIYVRNKVRACESLGLYSERIELPAETSTAELLKLIADLNAKDCVDGILVQLPLPPHIDAKKVLPAIDPMKDVDGLHPVNAGKLMSGRPGMIPCTPAGVIQILERSQIPIRGARAVVVGRSDMVGKPMAMLLLHQNATVTIC